MHILTCSLLECDHQRRFGDRTAPDNAIHSLLRTQLLMTTSRLAMDGLELDGR